MKKMKWLVAALALVLIQACASTKPSTDPTQYDRAVEKEFNENYQERLKY
jgi:outer membrane biogenesis lipoprotein LolB